MTRNTQLLLTAPLLIKLIVKLETHFFQAKVVSWRSHNRPCVMVLLEPWRGGVRDSDVDLLRQLVNCSATVKIFH